MKDKIKNMLDITFWKFIMVGVINTLVGTGVMFAAYNLLHLSYWVSSASNYVVGSIVSYFLNKYFTKPVVSWILHNQSKSVQENLSMLVGMGAFVVFNYVGQRLVVFKE